MFVLFSFTWYRVKILFLFYFLFLFCFILFNFVREALVYSVREALVLFYFLFSFKLSLFVCVIIFSHILVYGDTL